MNPTSFDIKDLLEDDSSLGLTYETNMFISKMTDQITVPNKCISIFDSPGFAPDHGPADDSLVERPGINIQVRGNIGEYVDTYLWAKAIRDFLKAADKHNNEVNYTQYIGIWSTGDPIFLGYDETLRPLFSLNFNIMRS